MALVDADLKQMGPVDSTKKVVEDVDSNEKEISWLIDNLPVTVFRVSNESSWAIHYISKNVEKLTGYSTMDFISQRLSWSEIVFPEDVPVIDKAIEKAMRNKTPYQVEYRIKKSDGETVFIQEQARLVNDDN